MDIQSKSTKMLATGMSFGVVSDIPVKGKFHFLQNVRVEITGEIIARPRLNTFLAFNRANTAEVPHSIKTIINKIDNSFNRIVGVGTEIWTGDGALLAQKDTGYSGKPLSIFDFRPESSVQAYAYIADENKFRKISVDNEVSDVGITVPNSPASWQIGAPERKIVDAIITGSDMDWNHLTGTASAPTLESRIATTLAIDSIADGALPNFINIVPTVFTPDIQAGVILELDTDEYIVDEVLPAALNVGVATIAEISYDAGAAGLCTIVLNISSPAIKRNSILLLNGTEYVRIEDVTFNDNGIPSIRTTTVGTFAIGNTVSGKDSFRVFSPNNYIATDTIVADYIETAITADGISSITHTFNVDLLNTASRALTLEDIFHISLLPDDPSLLTEIQIQLDVSNGLFDDQYFYYVVSPNFFTGSADQTTATISIIQQSLQRQQLLARQQENIFRHVDRNAQMGGYDSGYDDPSDIIIPGSVNEATLGRNQWKELYIPLKSFIKVGSDQTRTFKDVKAIRISATTTAAMVVSIDSIWVGGADALSSNSENFLAYNYIYRLRDPVTKESSNWSPSLRTGIRLSRGRVVLSFAEANAIYPATYKIDIARYGGTLNDFRLLGTVLNDGSTYTDTSSDRIIADNALAGRLEGNIDAVFDYYKPFTVLDTPKSGTCDIIGTKFIWKTGDKLDTRYPRGTLILIDGKVNKFYNSPATDETVELITDRGNLSDVEFEITDPLITGFPLPQVFGPFGEGNFGLFYFGLGYKNAAGTLYWLDGNSPSTMSDLNNLEITSPSEPLMAGVIYDGLPYVWTTEKSFQIVPTYAGEIFSFIARENANSRGLFSSYAICADREYIYFLSENADGIYRVAGNGNPQCITEGIANLFYNNDKAPSSPLSGMLEVTLYPPDFTKKDDLRLFSSKYHIFFRYIDMIGSTHCIVFDKKLNDWISFDTYVGDKVNSFYFDEQESKSLVLAGIPDGVAKVENAGTYEGTQLSKIVPFAFDAGAANLTKEFKEIVTSADEGILGFDVNNYLDNGDVVEATIPIGGSVGHKRRKFIHNLQDIDGNGLLATNIITAYVFKINSGARFYETIYYWIPQGDEITDRSGDIEDGGSLGEKLWQGVVIQANTFGADKTLNYYDDENILRATVEISCDGKQTIGKSFDQPFISHTIKRTSDDNVDWIPNNEIYVFDIEPESAAVWEGEFNVSDLSGLIMFKRMAIAYRSNALSTLKLFFDDETTQEYSLPNSNEDWHKEFFYVESKKWLACKYRIESEGTIRPYKKHCEIWMRGFTSNQPFAIHQPFGGDSNVSDIKI